MDLLLSELLSAPGFKDLSTAGGLAGLTLILQSEGCVDETGAEGNTSKEGFSKSGTRGPPTPGSTFPNSCTPVALFLAPGYGSSPQRHGTVPVPIVAASVVLPSVFPFPVLAGWPYSGQDPLLSSSTKKEKDLG